MAKHTLLKPIVAENPAYTTIIEKVLVRSIFPARMRYPSLSTGELYTWEKAGDVEPVLPEDVAYLLEKRIGKGGCCGAGNEGNKLFELA